MTYLTLVNNVLKRLRERTVSTVEETSYSTLIAMLVNDAKQEVEQAWLSRSCGHKSKRDRTRTVFYRRTRKHS